MEKALAAQRQGRGARGAARGAGCARAARSRARRKIVGGSTITQQLAKNLLLSGERTLLRKGQELVLAFALELLLTKQRILEIYLNSVEWGEGVFGAEAAAQHYFRKPASQPQRLRGGAAGGDAAAAPSTSRGCPARPISQAAPRTIVGAHAVALPSLRLAAGRRRAPVSSRAMLAKLHGVVPARAGPPAHRRAGALVRLPAQGRAAHLLRQPPEPRRPGDDLGRAAAGTAQHHAADRGARLLGQHAVQALDHDRGLQRDLRRARRLQPARMPASSATRDRSARQTPPKPWRRCSR